MDKKAFAMETEPPKSETRAMGLLVRKQKWGLSWRGRLTVVLLGIVVVSLGVRNIYPFLAVTQRLDAKVLVVEGWVHQYAIDASVCELRTNRYERVFTTGGPVIGSGGYTSDFNTAASVGADRLRAAGVPSELIQMVPSHESGRDRTYSSAVALRNWLQQNHVAFQNVNVITEDAHARRTKLLFEKAFSGKARIGVVSVPSPDYDARHWWRYSQGVENVVEQWIGYLYARFLFSGGKVG